MMSRANFFKSSLLTVGALPYLFAAYFMGRGAFDLQRFGDISAAGLIGILALLLGTVGLGSLVAATWSKKAPDCLVALHAAVAVLFVVISMQS